MFSLDRLCKFLNLLVPTVVVSVGYENLSIAKRGIDEKNAICSSRVYPFARKTGITR